MISAEAPMHRWVTRAFAVSFCGIATAGEPHEARTIRALIEGRWLRSDVGGHITIEEYSPDLADHAGFAHASDHWAARGDGYRFFLNHGGERVVVLDLLSAYGTLEAGTIDIEGDGVDELWYMCAEGRGTGPANRRWLVVARVEQHRLTEFFTLPLAGWYLGRTVSIEDPPYARWEQVHRFVDLDEDGDVEVEATLTTKLPAGVVLTRAEDLHLSGATRVVYTLRPDGEGMMIDVARTPP